MITSRDHQHRDAPIRFTADITTQRRRRSPISAVSLLHYAFYTWIFRTSKITVRDRRQYNTIALIGKSMKRRYSETRIINRESFRDSWRRRREIHSQFYGLASPGPSSNAVAFRLSSPKIQVGFARLESPDSRRGRNRRWRRRVASRRTGRRTRRKIDLILRALT